MRNFLLVATALALAACSISSPTTLSTTTASTETVASTSVTPTTIPAEEFTLFFMHDSGGSDFRPGPFLIPVAHPISEGDPRAIIEALLIGPTDGEIEVGISSSIPTGTDLNDFTISDGTATIDLSQGFDDGGGSLSMFARLAQLTYTVTAIEDVDEVILLLDGAPVEVFSSEGIIIDGPMVREDFEDLLPGIMVEDPAWNQTVSPEFTMRGIAAAFEGAFVYEIILDDAVIVSEQPAQTDNGLGYGDFSISVVVPATGQIILRVWEYSAEDGSIINERRIPLEIVE